MMGFTPANKCQLRSRFLYQLILAVKPVDSKAETKTKTEILVQNGITVVEPSAKLLQDLAAIGETMTAEWKEKAGETGTAILDAYKAN